MKSAAAVEEICMHILLGLDVESVTSIYHLMTFII